jgi:hypothetical protein
VLTKAGDLVTLLCDLLRVDVVHRKTRAFDRNQVVHRVDLREFGIGVYPHGMLDVEGRTDLDFGRFEQASKAADKAVHASS